MATIEINYRVNIPFHADVLLSSPFVQDVGRTILRRVIPVVLSNNK